MINDVSSKKKKKRIKTFKDWPLKNPKPEILAMLGLYYTGYSDRTRCNFCDIDIYKWDINDDPLKEHLKYSSTCPLLRSYITSNIAINPQKLKEMLPIPSYDE